MKRNGFILHLLIIILVVLIILSFLGLFSFTDFWNKFKNTSVGKWMAPILESIYRSLKDLFVEIWNVIKSWFWGNIKNVKLEVNLSPSVSVGIKVK